MEDSVDRRLRLFRLLGRGVRRLVGRWLWHLDAPDREDRIALKRLRDARIRAAPWRMASTGQE